MLRFRGMRSLQKFASMHSSSHNHFNLDRHLNSRTSFKTQRDAALLQWRELTAAQDLSSAKFRDRFAFN